MRAAKDRPFIGRIIVRNSDESAITSNLSEKVQKHEQSVKKIQSYKQRLSCLCEGLHGRQNVVGAVVLQAANAAG